MIDDFKINRVLVRLLRTKPKTCHLHDLPLDLACLTDKCKVCKYCMDFGEHKGHKIVPLRAIQTEAEQKKEWLQVMSQDFEICSKKIYQTIEEEKELMLKMTKEQFEKIRDLTYKKEKEVCKEILFCFEMEKNKIDLNLEFDLRLRNRAEERVAGLSDRTMSNKFLAAFEEEIKPFTTVTEYETFIKGIQQVRNELEKYVEAMCPPLESYIKGFHITLPSQEISTNIDFMNDDENVYKVCGPNMLMIRKLFKLQLQKDELTISLKEKPQKNEKITVIEEEEEEEVLLDLEKWKEIRKVKVELSNCIYTQEIDDSINYLWMHLYKISQLKINLSRSKGDNDEELVVFSIPDYEVLDDIQSFELNLIGCKVDEPSILKIMKDILPKMTGLSNLDICFDHTNITDETIHSFTSDTLLHFAVIEHIKLDLGYTKVSDESIIPMFKRMKGLKSLDLAFNCTQITDASLQSLTDNTLAHCSSLEFFGLGLISTQVTDQSLIQLFEKINPKIKSFELNLSHTKITDQSIGFFAEKILPQFYDLQSFSLWLMDIEITDMSAIKIFKSLKKTLRSFTLSLNNTKITDESICVFVNYILPALTCLHSYNLWVDNTKVNTSQYKKMLTASYTSISTTDQF